MSDFTTSAAPAATPAPTSTPDALSLDALKAVADLLGGGEVVAYRPVFAHVFGGATPALLLSQFWFWTNTPTVKGRDGWFYKTQREITQETGLTRRETDTARRKLVALGVLSENLRGVPATQHYHLHKERLYQLLWEHLEKQKASEKTDTSQFVRNRQTGLHKSAKLDCTKAPNKIVQKRQTSLRETAKLLQRLHQRPLQKGLRRAHGQEFCLRLRGRSPTRRWDTRRRNDSRPCTEQARPRSRTPWTQPAKAIPNSRQQRLPAFSLPACRLPTGRKRHHK